MKRFKNASMKTKSEDTNGMPSNPITKAQVMVWFNTVYQAQSGNNQDFVSGVKALNFLKNAAYIDANLEALCCLGLLYLSGSAVNLQNKGKGRTTLKLSADGGNISAVYCLARLYEGNQEKDQKAVELHKKAADAGHPGAQYHLGLRYRQGLGVEKNEEIASKYFIKAAKQGHKEAQSHLRMQYNEDHDIEKGEAKTLLSPVRSARDGEEKPSMVEALLSPRRERSPSTTAKPSMVKEELNFNKMESTRPSMMGGLLSPKRERKREERGKESTRMGVSPKKDPCKYHEDMPELRLSSSTSLEDSWQPIEGSARPNNSYGSIRRKSPRKSSFFDPKSNEGDTTSEERGKVSMLGLLSPRKKPRELTIGSPTSLTGPCRTAQGGGGLSDSMKRRESTPKSPFFGQRSNEDKTKEGLSNSLQAVSTEVCQK